MNSDVFRSLVTLKFKTNPLPDTLATVVVIAAAATAPPYHRIEVLDNTLAVSVKLWFLLPVVDVKIADPDILDILVVKVELTPVAAPVVLSPQTVSSMLSPDLQTPPGTVKV